MHNMEFSPCISCQSIFSFKSEYLDKFYDKNKSSVKTKRNET